KTCCPNNAVCANPTTGAKACCNKQPGMCCDKGTCVSSGGTCANTAAGSCCDGGTCVLPGGTCPSGGTCANRRCCPANQVCRNPHPGAIPVFGGGPCRHPGGSVRA